MRERLGPDRSTLLKAGIMAATILLGSHILQSCDQDETYADPDSIDSFEEDTQQTNELLKQCANERTQVTAPNADVEVICRPSTTADAAAGEENLPLPSPVFTFLHTVKHGENATQIGRQYNVELPSLQTSNSNIQNWNMISAGESLIVQMTKPQAINLKSEKSIKELAAKYEVEPSLLAAMNSTTEDANLSGFILLPLDQSDDAAEDFKRYYVKSGDTMWSIAETFNVPLIWLLSQNEIGTDTVLMPGMRVIIPKIEGEAVPTTEVSINIEDSGVGETTIIAPELTMLLEKLAGNFHTLALKNVSPSPREGMSAKEDGAQIVEAIDSVELSNDGYQKFLNNMNTEYAGRVTSSRGEITPEMLVLHYTTVTYDDVEHFLSSVDGDGKGVPFFINKQLETYSFLADKNKPLYLGHAYGVNSRSIGVEVEAEYQGDIGPDLLEQTAYFIRWALDTYKTIPVEGVVGHAMLRQDLGIDNATPRADWQLGKTGYFMTRQVIPHLLETNAITPVQAEQAANFYSTLL